MRLAALLAVFALAAMVLSGCGSSGDSTSTGGAAPTKAGAAEAPVGATTQSCVLNAGGAVGLRAAGVPCQEAQKVALAWRRQAACSASAGASRSACSVGRYRCLGARTDRGLAVSCARPGRAVSFTAKRR